MTKKDYIKFAEMLAYYKHGGRGEPREDGGEHFYMNIVKSIADIFDEDNRRFDRVRFYDAIGLLE